VITVHGFQFPVSSFQFPVIKTDALAKRAWQGICRRRTFKLGHSGPPASPVTYVTGVGSGSRQWRAGRDRHLLGGHDPESRSFVRSTWIPAFAGMTRVRQHEYFLVNNRLLAIDTDKKKQFIQAFHGSLKNWQL